MQTLLHWDVEALGSAGLVFEVYHAHYLFRSIDVQDLHVEVPAEVLAEVLSAVLPVRKFRIMKFEFDSSGSN